MFMEIGLPQLREKIKSFQVEKKLGSGQHSRQKAQYYVHPETKRCSEGLGCVLCFFFFNAKNSTGVSLSQLKDLVCQEKVGLNV